MSKINSEPVQKNQTYSNIHLNFKHNFILSMFGIRIETKILFSLNNWQRLAMNACGCTDYVKLVRAGHAGETEQTHNQKKELLLCLVC